MKASQRDIVRRALQAAVAGTGALMAVRLTGTGEAFLAVISAVLVLQTSREATMGSASSRIVGTLVGTAVGLAALALTDSGQLPWPLALSMLVMGALAAWKPGWRYGLVAAAGLAVGSEQGFVDTAWTRGVAIFLGAGIGIAAGSLVWPESARARTQRQIAEALAICGDLAESLLDAALGDKEARRNALHDRFSGMIALARDSAGAVRGEARTQFAGAVHRVERLWHAIIILDRVSETKRRSGLAFRDELLPRIAAIEEATCRALACAAELKRIPEEDLESLADACRTIWQEAQLDPEREDELQSVALIFGLHEISRNMREIDRAICAIAAVR